MHCTMFFKSKSKTRATASRSAHMSLDVLSLSLYFFAYSALALLPPHHMSAQITYNKCDPAGSPSKPRRQKEKNLNQETFHHHLNLFENSIIEVTVGAQNGWEIRHLWGWMGTNWWKWPRRKREKEPRLRLQNFKSQYKIFVWNVLIRGKPIAFKHRKNCECCPVLLLIVRSQSLMMIVINSGPQLTEM